MITADIESKVEFLLDKARIAQIAAGYADSQQDILKRNELRAKAKRLREEAEKLDAKHEAICWRLEE